MSLMITKDKNNVAVQVLEIGVSEELDGSSASSASGVFCAEEERVVRIAAGDDVRIAVGASPTAEADDMLIPAGVVEYFRIPAGMKVAVFGGVVTVTVMG